ncbi:hypothetical protein LINGRAPRIM_LOCUS1442 [Linum grandiflorum]
MEKAFMKITFLVLLMLLASVEKKNIGAEAGRVSNNGGIDEEVPCGLICPPKCRCHRNLCFCNEVQHPVATDEEPPCGLICPPQCRCHRDLCFCNEVQHPVAAGDHLIPNSKVENNGAKN